MRQLHIDGILVGTETIRIHCQVSRAFPDELRELIRSGTPVPLYLSASLHPDQGSEPQRSVLLRRTIAYDITTERCILINEPARDTSRFDQLDSALSVAARFDSVIVAGTNELLPEARYSIRASAFLGKTSIEALQNKAIDLMYFWNFNRPGAQTQSYSARTLLHRTISEPDTVE
jgi:hypothetical protein